MTAPVRYQSGRTIRERGRRQPLSNRTRLAPAGTFAYGPKIGIGGSLAAPPLPHHRTYGSVYGGSRSYANPL